MRLIVATTESALNGSPLWNVTPSRSVNSHVVSSTCVGSVGRQAGSQLAVGRAGEQRLVDVVVDRPLAAVVDEVRVEAGRLGAEGDRDLGALDRRRRLRRLGDAAGSAPLATAVVPTATAPSATAEISQVLHCERIGSPSVMIERAATAVPAACSPGRRRRRAGQRRVNTVYSEQPWRRQWSVGDGEPSSTPRRSGSRHLPLSHAVVDELRAAIIGGDYAQGERLVEEEIAARFDVSRNPIREALRTLSTEGFVVIEPRRGARVASIDAGARRRAVRAARAARGPRRRAGRRSAARRRTSTRLRRRRRRRTVGGRRRAARTSCRR